MLDVGLAMAAATHASAGAQSEELCPDLGMATSARALGALLAASAPVTEQAAVLGKEAPVADSMIAMSGLAPESRCWDERGFEALALEGGGPPAVGARSCGGLLGAAFQWPAGSGSLGGEVTTVVVLTNELSMAGVPAQLVAEVCSALLLPRPVAFS